MDWERKERKESLEDPDEEKSEKFRNDLEKCHMTYTQSLLRRN